MSGGQAILRMSPRIPYALRYLAPPSGSRLAYAASMHARLPHGPAALRLPFGAGLQSARAFSTGPAGARLFENMVTSVPFALRAGSCDLDLHGIRAYDFPHVTKTSHRSSSAGADTQRAVPVLPAMSHGFVDASRVATDSYEESPATSDLDMFFPLLLRTVRTPETHVVSRISIHLEPFVPDVALDTSELFMAQAPNANASATMLDYTTSERLRTLGGIYSVHRQRITKLESLLRSYGTWPCALNTSLLLKQHGEAVPATLHVDMKGWTKVQVQQMLLDNFGSSNWLQVEDMVVITEEDGGSEDSYLPFDPSSRVWADLIPVSQDDGPQPLCPILYDPLYAQAMGLFRALKSASNDGVEVSERALALTEHLIDLNPANYSIWQYRASILMQMAAEDPGVLRKELAFLNDFAVGNMKNYQIWQHRRIIVSILGDPSHELAFTQSVLDLDSKNYHTWAYREWVLVHFGGLGDGRHASSPGGGEYPQLWDGELAYTDRLLDEDVRNNSAYNHRFFCTLLRIADGKTLSAEHEPVRDNEIAYALGKVTVAPNNASVWNYLQGLHTGLEPRRPLHTLDARVMQHIPEPDHAKAAAYPDTDRGGRTPPGALEWMLESTLERIDAGEKGLLHTAKLILERLRHAETVREKYWQFRASCLPDTSDPSSRQWDGTVRGTNIRTSAVLIALQINTRSGNEHEKQTREYLLCDPVELPFNVWCEGCNAHIGQGVRFNAEKKQVDSYYSTPIWSFRYPKNTRYTVESGARQQKQDWDPAEHGGVPIYDSEAAVKTEQEGGFAQLEKRQEERKAAPKRQARIDELEEWAEKRWAEPYEKNASLRQIFRAEKHARTERAIRDAALRERMGWDQDKVLVGESSHDPSLSTPVIRQQWQEARRVRGVRTKTAPTTRRTRRAQLSPAAHSLADRLLAKQK
ncbi:Ram2p [Malassezia vespertilionis]|uniref:Protein farnesyltransferase/geranylgeranyltransferase type-1 subunit alpha n=1 Tax=Malassezia vespertilionis TaxID=2020962 RepID=A0A2N1JCD3_9BASI|nr:Ram2p [Malassezia vespertilionis]